MVSSKRDRRRALGAFVGVLGCAAGLAWTPASGAPRPTCGERRLNVYFDSRESELTAESRQALAAAQRSLQGCLIEHVRIVGLTGAKAPPGAAQQLSERRAQTVAAALVTGGWPRERMELAPIGDKGAKLGDLQKPMRRRVHIIVQSRPAS